jgi:pseudaminic acid biosynthesis-associated methylase
MFARMLARTAAVRSVLELGANVGLNMVAMRALLPHAKLSAIEINESAYRRLAQIPGVSAHHASILDFQPTEPVDFAFTSGVLIHISPDELPTVYRKLYQASSRYIAVAEYYNPSPIEIPYRGHSGRLFKRDWAGDLMDLHADLSLLDYGFIYHRDPAFPADDISWFVLAKR